MRFIVFVLIFQACSLSQIERSPDALKSKILSKDCGSLFSLAISKDDIFSFKKFEDNSVQKSKIYNYFNKLKKELERVNENFTFQISPETFRIRVIKYGADRRLERGEFEFILTEYGGAENLKNGARFSSVLDLLNSNGIKIKDSGFLSKEHGLDITLFEREITFFKELEALFDSGDIIKRVEKLVNNELKNSRSKEVTNYYTMRVKKALDSYLRTPFIKNRHAIIDLLEEITLWRVPQKSDQIYKEKFIRDFKFKFELKASRDPKNFYSASVFSRQIKKIIRRGGFRSNIDEAYLKNPWKLGNEENLFKLNSPDKLHLPLSLNEVPLGAIFVFKKDPLDTGIKSIDINFSSRSHGNRLRAVLVSREMLPKVQLWLEEVGIDHRLAIEFFDFVDK